MRPITNEDSWRALRDFIEGCSASGEDWVAKATTLVDLLEARGLSSYFRAGQSMHHLIFSTLDNHQLEDEPRVTVAIEKHECRIAYARTNLHFAEPAVESTVGFGQAESVVVDFLAKLWRDTRPQVALPPGCTDR